MRILVTGATGFLGRQVALALLAVGYEVHAITRSGARDRIDARIRWHTADLLNRLQVRTVLAECCPQGLVHLAWTTEHGEYWRDPANLDWVAASLHLFRDFIERGGGRIVVAGSSAEYDWTAAAPFDERGTPLHPSTLYGRSKNALREILEAWSDKEGVSWAWARIFNLFGPYENSLRLVPRVIRQLREGRDLPFDDGNLVRDFLDVRDAGAAFAAIYASEYQGTVNVASGIPTRTRDVVGQIAALVGVQSQVKLGMLQPPADAPSEIVASTHILTTNIGWKPSLTMAQGLGDACRWWASHADVAAIDR